MTFYAKVISCQCGFSNNKLHISKNSIQVVPVLHLPPKPKISIYPLETHFNPTQSMETKKKVKNNGEPTDILRLMDGLQLYIPQDVYAYLIKECTDLKDAESGAQIHSHMNRNKHHRPTLALSNLLLHMYVSCGRLDSTHQVFDEMIVKDSVSWAIMISGHVDNGLHLEALNLFTQMQRQGQQHGLFGGSVSGLIIRCVLHAGIHTGDLELGKQIHGLVLKKVDFCSDDLLLDSLFINFYGKLGCIESARCIFDNMVFHDTVICTTMIVVYSREKQFKEALEVFKEMGRKGTKKNNFTLSSVIHACGRMGNTKSGRQVHGEAIKHGVEMDKFVQCSLVDMYGKCGLVEDARRVFETTRVTGDKKRMNDVCWNAMLTAYVQNGFTNKAIKFLYKMKAAKVQPPDSLLNQLRIGCVN